MATMSGRQGKFANPPEPDLETWFIRGGSAGAALYTFLQPGIYAYVNHNLIEAVELGATAHFMVEGEWNDDLMKQVKAPASRCHAQGRLRATLAVTPKDPLTWRCRHPCRHPPPTRRDAMLIAFKLKLALALWPASPDRWRWRRAQ